MFEQLLFLLINLIIRKLNNLQAITLYIDMDVRKNELLAEINYINKPEEEEKLLKEVQCPVREASEAIEKSPQFTKKESFEHAKTDPHLKYDLAAANTRQSLQLENAVKICKNLTDIAIWTEERHLTIDKFPKKQTNSVLRICTAFPTNQTGQSQQLIEGRILTTVKETFCEMLPSAIDI
jgi:hypothetical protein